VRDGTVAVSLLVDNGRCGNQQQAGDAVVLAALRCRAASDDA
jgi:hypothetical protein